MPLYINSVKDSVECQIYVVYEGVLNKPEKKTMGGSQHWPGLTYTIQQHQNPGQGFQAEGLS